MGMSASQMRYCMLTGKKSDIEFQGQQINQQRTTLATESSQLNTQLLNLTVPTPPSSDSFVKTTYTFTSNGQSRTVAGTRYHATASAGNPAGTYSVDYTTDATVSQGKSNGSSVFSSTGTGANVIYKTTNGTVLTQVITNTADPNYDATDTANVALIQQDCGAPTTGSYYKYMSGGQTKYISGNNLAANANTTNAIPVYFVDDNATQQQSSVMDGCTVEWNDSGRMTSITDANGIEYALNVTTTNDEKGYNDAYNEYTYQKGLYEQQMNNINAKICIIQSDDKKLELKLQDLDTQQKAVSTELESVKKVIDKNVEGSFKTFA